MSQIIPFPFDDTQIQARVQGGTPLFVANDVAKALGYKDFRYAVRTYCRYARISDVDIPDDRGQPQRPSLIPESDVFRLVSRSKLPAADRFMDWVCDEVLPALRNEGHFAVSGSKLDRWMQRRTVGYRSLWEAYGLSTPPTSVAINTLREGFDRMARDAGLPAQFEGVAPDREVYMITPALARTLIDAYRRGKHNGGRKADKAIRWLESRAEGE